MNSWLFRLLIVAFIFYIIWIFLFSKQARIKRKLKRAPLKSIIDFKNEETAKIVGEAEPINKTIIAPLSGTECCHYYIKVQKKVFFGHNKRYHWVTVIEEEVMTDYVINDNGHYAFISGDNIESHIVRDLEFKSDLFENPTRELKEYLKKHDYNSEYWVGLNKILRYYEGKIDVNERIAVLGKGEWLSATELDLPEHYGKVLSISADKKKKHGYLSDHESVTTSRLL